MKGPRNGQQDGAGALSAPLLDPDIEEDAYALVRELRDLTHLLTDDIERQFNLNRGKVQGEAVTLTFQQDGISATHYLVDQVRLRVLDLVPIIEAIVDKAACAEGAK